MANQEKRVQERRYDRQEALRTAKDYFGKDMAAEAFINKYALQDRDGTLHEAHPKEMWERMASEAASIEEDSDYWEDEFYRVLKDFKAVPQGSIMFSLGNPFQKSSCSNCFVLPMQDSLESIFETIKRMAKTYAYRGGVGFDISALRPKGTSVANCARHSTGAVSFMDLFSYVTGLIGQAGRRGALMLTISDRHPDLYDPDGDDFVTMKRDVDEGLVENANISVRVSDDFMRAVQNDEEWTLSWRREDNKVYVGDEFLHEDEGRDMYVEKTYPAREIWDTIIGSATESAEPGVLFWDRIREQNPADQYEQEGFRTISTNPCSEIPLGAGGACTLLSMNLTEYIDNAFTEEAAFNQERFQNDVSTATRFLDNVKTIDIDKVPFDFQRKAARKGRRIGVGTHGLADALAMLRTKYDSEAAVDHCKDIYGTLRNSVYRSSINLAKEKEPFPVFDWQKHKRSPFIQRLPDSLKSDIAEHGIRNIAALTIAPTGTVSMISQTSSGIEPIFRLKYKRRVQKQGTEDSEEMYDVYHTLARDYIDQHEGAEGVSDLPDYFQTVDDIDWPFRTKLQGTIQNYIDHNISNTINIPADVDNPKAVVKESYEQAWQEGCKGYTVYVDGSREGVLLTQEQDATVVSDELEFKTDANIWKVTPQDADEHLPFYVIEGQDQIFISDDFTEDEEEYLRHLSNELKGALRTQLDNRERLDKYIERAKRRGQNRPIVEIGRLISLSMKEGIAGICTRIIKDHMDETDHVLPTALHGIFEHRKIEHADRCPDCGSFNVEHAEGCLKCLDCLYSQCDV